MTPHLLQRVRDWLYEQAYPHTPYDEAMEYIDRDINSLTNVQLVDLLGKVEK